MDVLWVDDDSPQKPKELEGIHVTAAKSIGEAEFLLKTGKVEPQWIIVDLIVPQDGWDDRWHAVPGVEYLKYLKEEYGGKIGLVAFGIAISSRKRAQAKAAGASKIFEKTQTSWLEVLNYVANPDAFSVGVTND